MEILRAVRRGHFADRAFERVAGGLGEADRRLAQELAYGVLRLRGRLDHVLGSLVRGGTDRLEPDVLDALRLGSYQLLELERVPAYAAVSDAVELAKRAAGPGAAALANAVLRRLSEATYAAFEFPQLGREPLDHLATWGSHPRWLLERWLARWPPDEVARLVQHDNSRPAVYLSVVSERDNAVRRLSAAGLAAEPVAWSATSLRVGGADLARALERVEAVVQDPGAAAVVDYMAHEPGVPLVDFCAAPGGKAALIAARGGEVWAFDVSRQRLARLVETRARLGLSRLRLAVADAREPPVSRIGAALLDVPCSGTGTLGRHPDARWRLAPGELEQLAQVQRRMLDAVADRIVPGGQLIYATCSLEPEENEEQIERFLATREDYDWDPPPPGAVAADLLDDAGALRVEPQRHGVDGSYAARLRRRSL